ncbi:MAG: hypothetical protein WDN46_25250 [Methylocella sp.]
MEGIQKPAAPIDLKLGRFSAIMLGLSLAQPQIFNGNAQNSVAGDRWMLLRPLLTT